MMIYSQTALAERFFSGNSATYEHIANVSTLGLAVGGSVKSLIKYLNIPGKFWTKHAELAC